MTLDVIHNIDFSEAQNVKIGFPGIEKAFTRFLSRSVLLVIDSEFGGDERPCLGC